MKFKKGLASLGPSSGKMKGKIFKVLQPIIIPGPICDICPPLSVYVYNFLDTIH